MAYFSVTTFQNLLLLFKNLCTISAKAINKEPTHPQAGTKIFLLCQLQRNSEEPTHPQAGTKILCYFNVTLLFQQNQPIPTRGRKLSSIDHIVTFWQEPTHPQAGTKMIITGTIKLFFITEPTHPQAGTKINCQQYND